MKNHKDDLFDSVLASVPINKTAARIISGGTHYEQKLNPAAHIAHSDCPLPIKPIDVKRRRDPCFVNLLGKKTGRLTVIGLADFKHKDKTKSATWVVRCACGNYEHRSSKAIKNPNNVDDACRFCRDWQFKQKRYREQGARNITEFVQTKSAIKSK